MGKKTTGRGLRKGQTQRLVPQVETRVSQRTNVQSAESVITISVPYTCVQSYDIFSEKRRAMIVEEILITPNSVSDFNCLGITVVAIFQVPGHGCCKRRR